jgi:predicted cytidylate kinase
MTDRIIITISGDLGSGKSTLSRLIAEKLELKRYSTGDIQRSIAASMNMTSLELNRLAEKDPEIDRRIDEGTVQIASENDRLVLDSRLAWHFVPYSFKIFLSVDEMVGAKRIMGAGRGSVEQYQTVEEAISLLRQRRESEDKRFKELYNADPVDFRNYDLVVDSSVATPAAVESTVLAALDRWRASQEYGHIWVSPRTPFPTCRANDAALGNRSVSVDPASLAPLELLRVGRYYYLYGDHTPAAAAIASATPLVPARLAASNSDLLPDGISAADYVSAHSSLPAMHTWEEIHGFQYPSYPLT